MRIVYSAMTRSHLKMLKQEFDAAELQEAEEVVGKTFVTDDQTAEVAEVSKEPLDLLAPLVTPEFSAVLGLGLFTALPMRGGQFDVLLGQLCI